MKTKTLVQLSLFCAIAIVLNIIDAYLPFPLGIRVGFANIIAMCVISLYGTYEMIMVNGLRVLLVGLLTGTFLSYPFFMSVAGVLCSSIMLIVLHRFDCSLPFTGVICALAHNIGQLLVLSFVVKMGGMMSLIVFLFALGLVSGLMTGASAQVIINRLEKK